MKVVIVNTSDTVGGAARAAYRLHQALLMSEIESILLCNIKTSGDNSVKAVIGSTINSFLYNFISLLDRLPLSRYKKRSKTMFSVNKFSANKIVQKINSMSPDIVHLHWVNQAFISIEDLKKLNAPIVWSLHDMWPITGGCHYDEECALFKEHCGNCKVLQSAKYNDLSAKLFDQKYKVYSKIKSLTFIGLSKWLQKEASQSALLQGSSVVNLPNMIDTEKYDIIDNNYSRKLWNLPSDKKLILFGAMGATSDPRKGFVELLDSLKYLDLEEIEFVVFGASSTDDDELKNYKIHFVGNLVDDISLITLYSAVDVMVVPSLQENLSNVIMESLSCSTPVVGFDIGGNSDMISHKINGYLATPYSSKDLANGINWVVNNRNYSEIQNNCRSKVLEEFEQGRVAKQYIELYNGILVKYGE